MHVFFSGIGGTGIGPLALIAKQGFQRVLVNGAVVRIDDLDQSAIRNLKSAITVVQDRVKLAPENRSRFVEGCEQAFHFGKGKLTIFEINARGLPIILSFSRTGFIAPRATSIIASRFRRSFGRVRGYKVTSSGEDRCDAFFVGAC